MNTAVGLAGPDDVEQVALMVGDLLEEIMAVSGVNAFSVDRATTQARLDLFLREGWYTVLTARQDKKAIGFAALHEVHSLYAEGSFGLLQEFYVSPACRSRGVGRQLLDAAKAHGRDRGWKRLEVTTPPLPAFDRALTFYQREGFVVTGGRKLKASL